MWQRVTQARTVIKSDFGLIADYRDKRLNERHAETTMRVDASLPGYREDAVLWSHRLAAIMLKGRSKPDDG